MLYGLIIKSISLTKNNNIKIKYAINIYNVIKK